MRRIASAGLSIALLAGAAPARAGDPAIQLALSVDTPATGGLALVSGRVTASGDDPVDLMLAIDTSHSTAARDAELRGWRRWLGWLFLRRRPPAPASALSDEIARALDALARLDPGTDRAGVVALAGDLDPRTPDAWVATPLGDLATARASLYALLARGSRGTTNLIDALELARGELLDRARPGARRVLMLLTDGVDVHPLHPDPGEARALLEGAVARASAAGIEVGVTSLSAGPARSILDGIAGTSGMDVAEIGVVNTKSGARATTSRLSGDRFAALVPLSPGVNALEIRARTRSGLETRRELEVLWDPSSRAPAREPGLLREHNDLLAAHLRALRARGGPKHSLEIEAAPPLH